MNKKIEELDAILELLREWVIKYDEELHAFVNKGYTNAFNDPHLPKERQIDITHFYEPDGEIKTTAGEGTPSGQRLIK